MEVFRLDSVSPELADLFRHASSLQRRQAALMASLIAVSQTGLQGVEVETALNLLRAKKSGEASIRQKVEALSAQYDQQYFDERKGDSQAIRLSALHSFQRARAASAVAYALAPDAEVLHEAIYEGIMASDNQAEAIRAVQAALKSI